MPKTRRITLTLPGATAAEVAERLRAKTKTALFPTFSNPLRGRGPEPLAGRVSEDGFRVALNEAGYKRVEPVARATIEQTEGGVTVTGEVGIAPFMVWLLRLNYLFAVAVCLGVGAQLIGDGEPAWFAALFAFMVVASTVAVGWNVSRAEGRLPELAQLVEGALIEASAAAPEAQVDTEAAEELESKRRAAAAQRQG